MSQIIKMVLLSMFKSVVVFGAIQLTLVAGVAVLVAKHQPEVQVVKTPPPALAQWYKPQNKRQVWLHNMFKLRREMQAIEFHAQRQDSENVDKWLTSLEQHYLKIGEMVPSWDNKLDPSLLAKIRQSNQDSNFDKIPSQLEQLATNCQSCHEDFRSVVATLYRAPDFTGITLTDDTKLTVHMDNLSRQINLIKIASSDGLPSVAQGAFTQLSHSMDQLGEICVNCHKNDSQVYPSPLIKQTLVKLDQALQHGTLKDQGQQLGALAVQACATCHGTHRLSFDNRTLLSNETSWQRLFKH